MSSGTLNKFVAEFEDGDVIAFAGRGTASRIIQRVTRSSYSHVGVVLRMSVPWFDEPQLNPRTLFIAESTTLNDVPDVTGEYRRGVQIVPLVQRLSGYDGNAWHVPLKQPLSDAEKRPAIDWLLKGHSSRVDYDCKQAIAAGLDYNARTWIGKLLLHPFRRYCNADENLTSLFCSELVTAYHKLTGRISCKVDASEQTPADVVAQACFGPPVQIR